VLTYIVWFIVEYWRDVIRALWGWFKDVLYPFFTKKIQCTLGTKWYITMVTGWRSCNPRFAYFVNKWRRRYIDGPMAREQQRYLAILLRAKQRYYTEPMNYYIRQPLSRYQVKVRFALERYVRRPARRLTEEIQDLVAGSQQKATQGHQHLSTRIQQSRTTVNQGLVNLKRQTRAGLTKSRTSLGSAGRWIGRTFWGLIVIVIGIIWALGWAQHQGWLPKALQVPFAQTNQWSYQINQIIQMPGQSKLLTGALGALVILLGLGGSLLM
jgi:hypothetical protein